VTVYLTPPCTAPVRAAIEAGALGMMTTPGQGNRIEHTYPVLGFDNGCFGDGYPGDVEWLAWLEDNRAHAGRALFATAPDVFTGAEDGSDAAATIERSLPFLPAIRELGYPAALVMQAGVEEYVEALPWQEFDVAFIGGTTGWKCGPAGADVIRAAQARGKGTHVGRVNSEARYRRFAALGVDSVDGTYLTYGPDANLSQVLAWVRGYDVGIWRPPRRRHPTRPAPVPLTTGQGQLFGPAPTHPEGSTP
jgi:hypothetical protein